LWFVGLKSELAVSTTNFFFEIPYN